MSHPFNDTVFGRGYLLYQLVLVVDILVLQVFWDGEITTLLVIGSGVGGGMAFTAPIMLGLPWTPLVLAAFVLLRIKPDPLSVASFIAFSSCHPH